MAAVVGWLDTQQRILQLWLGRLEGLLARHWPEVTRLLGLRSATLLYLLAQYGGPDTVAADASAAPNMRRWGGRLKATKIEAVLESARHCVGVRLSEATRELIQSSARQALLARKEIRDARRQLRSLAAKDQTVQRLASVVGTTTACVLRVALGDPHHYPCGEAYRKAMGLNLREYSSGKYQGRVRITKRGSSLVRRWLYFAALRMVQHPAVKPWYEAKKHRNQNFGKGAVVAVMRKLALAAHAVATRGETFSPERLLPGLQNIKKAD